MASQKISHFLYPNGTDLAEKYRRVLSGLVVIAAAPVLFFFSMLHIAEFDYLIGLFLLFVASGLTVSIFSIRRFQRAIPFFRINIVATGFLFFLLFLKSSPKGHMVQWLFIFPIVSLFLLGSKEGLFYALGLAFFIGGAYLFHYISSRSFLYDFEFFIRFNCRCEINNWLYQA